MLPLTVRLYFLSPLIADLTIWLPFWPMKCGQWHESFFLFALWFGYLLFTCLYFYTSHNKFCLLAWKLNFVFFHCFCLNPKCILITPIHSLNTYIFLQKNKYLHKFLVYLVSITFILIKCILYKMTSPLLKIHIFLFFSPRVFKKTKQLTIYCITLIFSTFCCNTFIYPLVSIYPPHMHSKWIFVWQIIWGTSHTWSSHLKESLAGYKIGVSNYFPSIKK